MVLRKLGFTVEEISSMQKGQLSFTDAADENIGRLEKEIVALQGALELTKSLSAEKSTFEALDQNRLWDEITQSERGGQKFADICRDYLVLELDMFDRMWKYVFFHDFKKSRKRYGFPIALCIVLLICVARGIASVLLWHESFWSGFLYPFVLFAIGSAIVLPIYILSKKAPKIASVLSTIFVVCGIAFLSLCVLVILYGLIRLILP